MIKHSTRTTLNVFNGCANLTSVILSEKYVENKEINRLFPLYALGPMSYNFTNSGNAVCSLPHTLYLDSCDAGSDVFDENFGPSLSVSCKNLKHWFIIYTFIILFKIPDVVVRVVS